MRAVAGDHPVAVGGGEQAAEFGLRPVASLAALVSATLLHEREARVGPNGLHQVGVDGQCVDHGQAEADRRHRAGLAR